MNWKRESLVLIIVGLGPILLFGPILLRGDVLFWGTPILQFVPWHEFALDVVKTGHFPLWNPLLGFGAPLFANYQSALLYPPNLFLILLGPAYGHGVLVTVHLILAGVGMVLLARKLGLAARGQMIAGIAFSLSGYLVARGGFISINHTAAWLPWIIMASERIAVRRSSEEFKAWFADVLPLGVCFGLQWLAGHAQTSWYTLLFALAWITWRSLQFGGWQRLGRNAIRMLTAGMIGLILSAVQLVPTLEYLLQSQRAVGLDQEFALTYSFWPWRLAGLIAPDLFGNPASGTYWGYGNYWEDAIYIGVFPLLMALGTVPGLVRVEGGRQRRQLPLFLVTASVVALVLALGKNTFVFRFLYTNIPTFDLFQAPTRWNLLFVFSFSLLAGIGIQGWSTPQDRALYWTRLGTAGAGIIAVASYVGSMLLGDVEPTFIPAFARAGLLLFTTGLLTLFLNKKREWLVLSGIGVFILLDLLTAGYGLNPAIDPGVLQGPSRLSELVNESERVYMPADLEYSLKFERSHRFDTFNPGIDWRDIRDIGLPNTTMLDGIHSANNFDPFTPARFDLWLEWLQGLPIEQQNDVLRWAGVRWRARPSDSGILGVEYEDLGVGARAWLLPEAEAVLNADQVLDRLAKGAFDHTRTVIIEAQPQELQSGSGGDASITPEADPNEIRITTSSDSGGWLLVNETWYPGWKVTIDGEPTELLRANYLFMGVKVPEGQRIVEFKFQPSYMMPTALLSGLGWFATVTFGIWLRRQ